MATIPVKWYQGTMQGAPNWGRSPGNFISFLDAILVNGFNSITLTSLVVANGIATATRTAGHGFILNQVIKIDGATLSGLNGEWRVTSIPDPTKFTFTCDGVADGTASGTITAKTPPLGWEKVFSGTNKGVYRSPNVLSPRSFYWVDDTYSGTNGVTARVIPYCNMTDINTGTDAWVTDALSAHVAAPYYGNTWIAVGDDRTLYLFSWGEYYSGIGVPVIRAIYWGDYDPISPTDVEAEMISLTNQNFYSHSLWTTQGDGFSTVYNQRRLRRSELGALGGWHYGYRQLNDHSGYGGPSFPSVVDGGMMLSNAWIREEGNGYHLRGKARGTYWVLANQPFSFSNYSNGVDITGVAGLEGRIVRILPLYYYITGSTYYIGRIAMDITGPWG